MPRHTLGAVDDRRDKQLSDVEALEQPQQPVAVQQQQPPVVQQPPPVAQGENAALEAAFDAAAPSGGAYEYRIPPPEVPFGRALDESRTPCRAGRCIPGRGTVRIMNALDKCQFTTEVKHTTDEREHYTTINWGERRGAQQNWG